MKTDLLSIAIVNYNNRKELKNCLTSIYQTQGPIETEVFVSDNNSTDGSQQMLSVNFPDVHLIKNSENMGLSRAMNVILKRAFGNYILFLDSDTELKPGALNGLLTFLSKTDEAGIAGPRVYNEDGTIQETARRFPNLLSGLFGRRTLIRRLFPDNPVSKKFMCIEKLDEKDPFEVDYVSAACMMMKRQVVEQLERMDEAFFVYWTDVDWCRRAKNRGHKVFCVPSAEVIHYERYQPLKKKSPKMIIDFHRGAYFYYSKHHVERRFSPLNIFSAAVLTLRTLLHLFLNIFKSRERKVC